MQWRHPRRHHKADFTWQYFSFNFELPCSVNWMVQCSQRRPKIMRLPRRIPTENNQQQPYPYYYQLPCKHIIRFCKNKYKCQAGKPENSHSLYLLLIFADRKSRKQNVDVPVLFDSYNLSRRKSKLNKVFIDNLCAPTRVYAHTDTYTKLHLQFFFVFSTGTYRNFSKCLSAHV